MSYWATIQSIVVAMCANNWVGVALHSSRSTTKILSVKICFLDKFSQTAKYLILENFKLYTKSGNIESVYEDVRREESS